MAISLRVAGRDLSSYIRVQHDEGLDPVDAAKIEPQFGGLPSFGEGQEGVGEAVSNREWTVPLLLDASSRSALHQLIQDIQNDLVNGAQVEFAPDSADAPSYFVLEAGRLDVTYEYFLGVHATYRATLKMWTRPFAGTGTARTLASYTGTQAQDIAATGIIGDVDALANLEVKVGTTVATSGRLVAFGVHKSASFRGYFPASGIPDRAASSIATGYAHGFASGYLAFGGKGNLGSYFVRKYLTPPEAYVGRHRVFAAVRNDTFADIPLYAKDRWGAALGATVTPSAIDQDTFGLVDLGEVQVAARASGQEAVATQYVELYGAQTPSAGYRNGTFYGLALAGLYFLPLDISAGILRNPGAYGPDTEAYSDSYTRVDGAGHPLENPADGAGGGNYRRMAGWLGWPRTATYGAGGRIMAVAKQGLYSPTVLASAQYSFASGVLSPQDSVFEISVALGPATSTSPTLAAASAFVRTRSRVRQFASFVEDGYVEAGLHVGPTPWIYLMELPLFTGATRLLASAGMASMNASSLFTGEQYRFMTRVAGATAELWLTKAANPGTANIVGGSVVSNVDGWWQLLVDNGRASSNSFMYLDNMRIAQAAAVAAPPLDSLGDEYFRFQSYPENRVYQGNASVFKADRTGQYRGAPPKLPPVGSPGASGAARMIVFAGDLLNWRGSDTIGIRLDANERFRFLR